MDQALKDSNQPGHRGPGEGLQEQPGLRGPGEELQEQPGPWGPAEGFREVSGGSTDNSKGELAHPQVPIKQLLQEETQDAFPVWCVAAMTWPCRPHHPEGGQAVGQGKKCTQ